MAAKVGQGFRARSPTAWEQAQAWKTALRAKVERFLDHGKTIRQNLTTASSSRITGTVDIAIQVAIDRVHAESDAKARAAANLKTAAPIKELPTAVYAGDSTINLKNNIITLFNGTRVDLRTGAQLDIVV